MSTITVVKKAGLVAIAADTLTTYGGRKEPAELIANHQKIFHFGDSYLGVVGPAAGKHILRHHFGRQKGRLDRMDSVEAIFDLWLKLHAALKKTYYILPEEDEEDSYESSRMDVLIANPHGIFGVDAHRCVQEFTRYYAYGYGQDYALGAMYAVYEDPARSAQDIAKMGVAAAAEFDNSTAPPIISYTVPLASPAGSAGG